MVKSKLESMHNLQFIRALFDPGHGLVQILNDRWTKIQMAVHCVLPHS